ncbi:hypothetical protein [Jannaschia marina]|uniref:hypothetical protein n=1 Tax=Jannaschia marina TaxID=2741674 RepID=UPI0015CCBDBA|nr:hypothetical protein [Jannaschia marina]
MAVVIAILAAIGGALFFWARSNPGDAIDVASDVAQTARNAPRRFAFRRQTKAHPVQGIDDPVLAIATIGAGFVALDGAPRQDDFDHLTVALRKTWRMSEEEASELLSLARWLVDQCGGGSEAVDRTARRLYRLDEGASWPQLEGVLTALGDPDLSEGQQETLAALRRTLTRPR